MPDPRTAVLNRLKRIEGQMRGLQKMIDEHRSCEEVLAQVLSARTALDGVAAQVATAYLDECLAKPPAEARHQTARVVQLLTRVG